MLLALATSGSYATANPIYPSADTVSAYSTDAVGINACVNDTASVSDLPWLLRPLVELCFFWVDGGLRDGLARFEPGCFELGLELARLKPGCLEWDWWLGVLEVEPVEKLVGGSAPSDADAWVSSCSSSSR